MKYILSFLFFFILHTSQAQTDSSKLYSYNVQIRANDLEQSLPIFLSSETYEDLFDLIKTKYKSGAPAGTSLVMLDSVRNDALVGWYTYIMQLQNGLTGAWANRVRNAFKTPPASTYVIRQCTAIDAIWDTQQTAVGHEGKRRYLKQRN